MAEGRVDFVFVTSEKVPRGNLARIKATMNSFNTTTAISNSSLSSHSIKWYDPYATLRNTDTTPDGTNPYGSEFVIPESAPRGVWRVTWAITYSSKVNTEHVNFEVV